MMPAPCLRCNSEDVPDSEIIFTKRGNLWGCKTCWNEYQRNWRNINKKRFREIKRKSLDKHKDRVRSYQLTVDHQINLEEYNRLLILQNEVCAICFEKCDTGKNLAVDHDHKTNKNRGLLCNSCNLMIGHSRDNIKNLLSAIDYLSKYSNLEIEFKE